MKLFHLIDQYKVIKEWIFYAKFKIENFYHTYMVMIMVILVDLDIDMTVMLVTSELEVAIVISCIAAIAAWMLIKYLIALKEKK